MSDQLAKRNELISRLNPKEKDAYEKYVSANKPPLSPKTSGDLFTLYLNGSSCEEIATLNPAFGLGIIVRARIDFEWDIQKNEYVGRLYSSIQEKVQKTQLESVDFISNALTVYHQLWNDKFKKYLQTKDPKVLDGFEKTNFKTYKEHMETLLKITGQEVKKQEIMHTIVPSSEVSVIKKSKVLSSEEADEILKTIDADFKERK